MQFKLIKDGDSIRKHDINILKEVIFNLEDTPDSYIILEPKHSIQNSIYLQAVRQDNIYIAETRLIFDRDENFRHYSKVFTSAEDLFGIFSDYYLYEKAPDIKEWIDDTSSLREEANDNMVKLYKTINGHIHYFEVWTNEDDSLTVHEGEVGDIGETKEINDGIPALITIAKLTEEKKRLGYEESIHHIEILIQYPTNIGNTKNKSTQAKRDKIEYILNNSLGWTGNGHCESCDIDEQQKIIAVCYVIDKDIAIDTIIEDLDVENLSEGLHIAYADETTEEYIHVYP